jgi:hypothetical protein
VERRLLKAGSDLALGKVRADLEALRILRLDSLALVIPRDHGKGIFSPSRQVIGHAAPRFCYRALRVVWPANPGIRTRAMSLRTLLE